MCVCVCVCVYVCVWSAAFSVMKARACTCGERVSEGGRMGEVRMGEWGGGGRTESKT
jgi:hypothetical protein